MSRQRGTSKPIPGVGNVLPATVSASAPGGTVPGTGSGTVVNVSATGAITGNGTTSQPLAVAVDGTTITIVADRLVVPATGTVTTTGSPTSGKVAKFSGPTSITNGDVSEFGYWSILTNGDPASPEVIFDANGDVISMWTPL